MTDLENHNIVYVDAAPAARCRDFATRSVGTNVDQYKRRNQTDPRVIERQIFVGKLGEFAAVEWLKRRGYEPTEADFEIYPANRKSYAADLRIVSTPIHVKSQEKSAANRFGLSWTFQYGGSTGSDREIFCAEPKGSVILTMVDGCAVHIYGAPLAKTLRERDLFRDPLLPRLRGIKTVVYYKDFKELSSNERWSL
jgi:hypothetical protein